MKRTAKRSTDPIYEIARDEISRWHGPPRDYALVILFCFIHRLTTGRTFEEDFCSGKEPIDYQI